LVNFQNGKMNVIKFSNFNLLDFPSKKDNNGVKRRSSMRDVSEENIRKTPSGEVSQSLVEMFSNSTPGAYATFSGGFTKKKKRSAISESQKEIPKEPKETPPLKEAKSMRALTDKKSLKFFNFVKKDRPLSVWFAPEVFSKQLFSKENDIWSFGLLIYMLVKLKRPYEDLSFSEATKQILAGPPKFGDKKKSFLWNLQNLYESRYDEKNSIQCSSSYD